MAASLIDLEIFDELQQTAGADFVVELLEAFFGEAPENLAAMRTALAARASEPFRRAAHYLKANAQTFGATALGAAALALEHDELPHDTAPLDALDNLYTETITTLREMARDLRQA